MQLHSAGYVDLRVVGVEVLVYVKDEARDATIGVCHRAESVCGAIGDEGLGGGPVVTGQKDELGGGTAGTFIRTWPLYSLLAKHTQLGGWR